MRKGSGGSAFPRQHFRLANGTLEGGDPGLTLRDYFAAKAMQHVIDNWHLTTGRDGTTAAEDYPAKYCYQVADAMIKARDEL